MDSVTASYSDTGERKPLSLRPALIEQAGKGPVPVCYEYTPVLTYKKVALSFPVVSRIQRILVTVLWYVRGAALVLNFDVLPFR